MVQHKGTAIRQTVAIVSAQNEERSVSNVLRQLARARISRVVVVCNGSSDATLERTRETTHLLDFAAELLWFRRPLGHDVPRAIGAYAALRTWRRSDVAGLLFVDGDWAGSFGPMLEGFLTHARTGHTDILGIPSSSLPDWDGHVGLDDAWAKALSMHVRTPADVVPYVLPMWVRSAVFEQVSPRWLAFPGAWFAATVQSGFTWTAYREWDMRLLGHLSRSSAHRKSVSKLIHADGVMAQRWLQSGNRELTRMTDLGRFGDLPERDERRLLRFASELRATEIVNSLYSDPPLSTRQTNRA